MIRMMRRRRFAVVAAAFMLASAGWAFAYLTDSGIYAPPSDYDRTRVAPRVGVPYRDMVFNPPPDAAARITRLTEAAKTSRVDGVPGNPTAIVHEYSTTTPFNNDRTRLLLIHDSYFAVYDSEGGVRPLVEVCATCSPRWSRSDPDVFYYTRSPGIYAYDAASDSHHIVAELDYDRLLPRGEDDICFDGDHLVGFGQRGGQYYLYVFSISRAEVISELLIGGAPAFANIDSAEIAPGDIVVVSFVANDTEARGLSGHGIWAYDIDFAGIPHQVSTAGGHHDVGRDVDGSPILVMTNSGSYHPLPDCPNGIEKIRIATPSNRECLLSLHWTMAVHVSLPDSATGAFVSTYAPGDPIYGAVSRKEERSPSLAFSGAWTPETKGIHSEGRAVWSTSGSLTYWFYGTSFRWIGYRDSSSGIARISVDGQTELVDLYSRNPVPQTVTHRRNNLPDVYYPNVPPGFHRVTIEATGTKNPRSRGYQVWVDAVEDDPPWTPYMNEILQVKLDGTEVRRLAHHRSRPFDTYNYTPKASVSRDGRALLFSSNYGALKDAYTGNADTYLMEIPQ